MNNIIKIIFYILPLFWFSQANAVLYKCTAKGYPPQFSDKACPPGFKSQKLRQVDPAVVPKLEKEVLEKNKKSKEKVDPFAEDLEWLDKQSSEEVTTKIEEVTAKTEEAKKNEEDLKNKKVCGVSLKNIKGSKNEEPVTKEQLKCLSDKILTGLEKLE